MAATTSTAFPLATQEPYTGPDSASGDPSAADNNAAGASGSTPGALEISRGAMIAIIVVVVVVGIMGSE